MASASAPTRDQLPAGQRGPSPPRLITAPRKSDLPLTPLHRKTQLSLNQINEQFYRQFAGEFSSTRGSYWQGWNRIRGLHAGSRILDLGCGNGRFCSFVEEAASGSQRKYVGTDQSLALLAGAKMRYPEACFVCHDLLTATPSALFEPESFDLVVAFGVMHHIPGFSERCKMLQNAGGLLRSGGALICTFWQFELDPRFDARRQDWNASPVEIDTDELETGDHLLRWGGSADPAAVRYCHFTSHDEVLRLADASGMRLDEVFFDDGKTRKLNLYGTFSRQDGSI